MFVSGYLFFSIIRCRRNVNRRHEGPSASPTSTRVLGDGQQAKPNALSCKADCKVQIYMQLINTPHNCLTIRNQFFAVNGRWFGEERPF
jgi:hypothetical protein